MAPKGKKLNHFTTEETETKGRKPENAHITHILHFNYDNQGQVNVVVFQNIWPMH